MLIDFHYFQIFNFFLFKFKQNFKMNTQSNVLDLINAMISDPITDNSHTQKKTDQQPSTSNAKQQPESPEPKRKRKTPVRKKESKKDNPPQKKRQNN